MIWLLLACRAEPGLPDYPDPTAGDDTASGGGLPGIVPYEYGDERLSYGAFYEGEATEALVIDDVTRHLYVYENSMAVGTSEDCIEGYESDRIGLGGTPAWFGAGIHWDTPEDLSDWTTLRVALRSDDALFEGMTLGMTGGGTETSVAVTDYGFAADDDWHGLAIPLSDFTGVDLSSVTVGLLILGTTNESGAAVFVDDLYLSKE